MVQGQDYKVDA